MKLVVLGANGRTGKHVLQIALEKGMDVTAVVRTAGRVPKIHHDRLNVKIGNPCDPAFLRMAFEGQDTVLSTLGGRRPSKQATSIYYRSAYSMVTAASDTGLNRILVTSSALLFPARTFWERVLPMFVPNVVQSATQMESILTKAQVNWTIARCGFLNDFQETSYRAENGILPEEGASVSRLALAQFLVDSIDNPAAHRAVFGVSSALV